MITRKEIDSMDPNMFVPWFIMASYGYYVLGRNIMDDEDFDYLTSRLIDCFDEIEHILPECSSKNCKNIVHQYLVGQQPLCCIFCS